MANVAEHKLSPERDERGRFLPGITPHNKKKHIRKECRSCGKVFYVKPSLDRVKACSGSCARKGMPSPLRGRKMSDEAKEKMRQAKLGNGGPTHWNYKHGKRPMHSSAQLRDWRKAVFTRDDYTCQCCNKRGVQLEAHHIKKWAKYPDLRFEIDNGITVCVPCHAEIDPDRARFLGGK